MNAFQWEHIAAGCVALLVLAVLFYLMGRLPALKEASARLAKELGVIPDFGDVRVVWSGKPLRPSRPWIYVPGNSEDQGDDHRRWKARHIKAGYLITYHDRFDPNKPEHMSLGIAIRELTHPYPFPMIAEATLRVMLVPSRFQTDFAATRAEPGLFPEAAAGMAGPEATPATAPSPAAEAPAPKPKAEPVVATPATAPAPVGNSGPEPMKTAAYPPVEGGRVIFASGPNGDSND